VKKFIYLLLALFLPLALFSQQNRRDKIESLRVAIYTQKIGLTPEESKVFWPVYDQYNRELQSLNQQQRNTLLKLKADLDQMSNADVEKLVDQEIAYRTQEATLAAKYHEKFKKVLPIQKVAKLYMAEVAFKKELLKRIKGSRE
jgi:hypothetical protein